MDKGQNAFDQQDEVGRLYIVQSDDVKSLVKEGVNLYKFKSTDELSEMDEGSDVVSQGFLETSNINPVNEMVNLIEANRMVEIVQKSDEIAHERSQR